MFSFIKKVVTSVIPWSSDSDEVEEQKIIDFIKELNSQKGETPENMTSDSETLLGQSDFLRNDVETFKCVHKTGKVTHLCDECGLIDDVVYFEPHQVSPGLVLKPKDEVLYTAYRAKENEAERVYKVYALKNDSWEHENIPKDVSQPNNVEKVEEISALTRFITGRVTRRRGREVYIESADIWCNLDKIQATFIPTEGDWVELSAVVTLTEETANLSGDIVEVKSIKPLLIKSGFGRITFWAETKREGAIENKIYFTSDSCEEGYLPALGGEVVYDAVESQQGRFSWRAVRVVVQSKMEETSVNDNKNNNSATNELNIDPFGDKNGITITPTICSLEIELHQRKNVEFIVTNNGEYKQLLKYTKFQGRGCPQVKLVKPKLTDYFFLPPKASVTYEFQCEGKSLGLTGEVFYFYFRNFKIAKRFEINVVGNKEMNKLLQCKFDTIFKVFKDRSNVKNEVEADVTTYGPRPWKPPKFISRERRLIFNIPKKLWNIPETHPKKYLEAITNYAPFLKTNLNFEYYAERFHTLLYLEEIKIRTNIRKFDMEGVFLEQEDEYFTLNVPGLSEKRPSVIIGDKIVLTQPWTGNEKTNTKHIGYIYHIRAKDIFIKFHGSFHKTYDGSECNIAFEPNINFFSRCHEAINRAVKTHGEDWLFPSAVNEKPSQINVEIPTEQGVVSENVANFFKTIQNSQMEIKPMPTTCELRKIESSLKPQPEPSTNERVRNLVWVNKNLNERQKLAVVSVLKGKGRPLPYIIFGPPGTGKTMTLVEIIIQFYRFLPDSRILVVTPSNSSADLICERLIEMGNFKPGQLVRLIALYRVFEGLVPLKLIPYSTFFNASEGHGKNMSEVNSKHNIKGSSFNELAGRHRITVATCVTIGLLHYSGILPGHFTHILVDEAGQTSEPEVLISTTFQNVENGQIILTGDPQQLGPVVCSSVAKTFGLGVSLLQRLISTFPYARDIDGFPETSGFDPRFITKLNVNYRTVPEILSLPSQMFYNSDLIPTVSQTDSKEAEIIKKFNFATEDRDTPPAIIFHGVVGQNYQESDSPSWFNPHEIWQVVFYVRKLYSVGLDCQNLGIVSPYAKQVQKLKVLLAALDLSVPKIGSVEEFQGQERDVVIVTTVRSSTSYLKFDIAHSLGFVASPQRLNVALTRARALLILIGNPFLLSRDPYWMNVVKYCVKNKSYTGCSLSTFEGNLLKEADEEEEEKKEEEGEKEEKEEEEGEKEEKGEGDKSDKEEDGNLDATD